MYASEKNKKAKADRKDTNEAKRKDTNEDEYVLAERLRDAKRKCLLSESELAELDTMHINILMNDIRAFGRVPRLKDNDHGEYVLAERLRWARRKHLLSQSQLAELETMPKQVVRADVAERMNSLVAQIRELGHVPRRTKFDEKENDLAQRLKEANRQNLLSESNLADLAGIPKLPRGSMERAQRMDKLIADIEESVRKFRRMPRSSETYPEECKLAARLRYARHKAILGNSDRAQLADLVREEAAADRERAPNA